MQKILRSQQFILFLLGCGVLLLFVGFSYLVHRNLFLSLDFDTTVRLQEHISRRFDSLFSFFSDIGKFEIVTVFLLIVCSVLAFYKKWQAFLLFIFFGAMHLLEIYGKTFVSHLPPPHFMLRTHDVFNFPQFYVSATNSYPSGHAGRALFVTAFLGILVGKSKKLSQTQKLLIFIGIGIYDIIMLSSRIYLGEHWLSDVIGGSILGVSMGLLGSLFT